MNIKKVINLNAKNKFRVNTKDSDVNDILLSSVRNEIHTSIGFEISSIQNFTHKTQSVPYPNFILSFSRKYGASLCLAASFMFLIAILITIFPSPIHDFNHAHPQISKLHVSCAYDSGRLPALHK